MAKQEHLPTMEQPSIPELSDAGMELRKIRRERMKLTESEVAAAEKVMALMHENKVEVYEDKALVPLLKLKLNRGKEKVSVNIPGEDDDGLSVE